MENGEERWREKRGGGRADEMGDGGWVSVEMGSAACVRRASGRDGGRDDEMEKMMI